MLQLILGLGVLHDITEITTEVDGLAAVGQHSRVDKLRAAKMKSRQAQKRKIMAEREKAEARRLAKKKAAKRAELANKQRSAKAKKEAQRKAKLEAKRQAQKRKAALERNQARRDRIEMQRRVKAAEKKRQLAAKRKAEALRKVKAEQKAKAERQAKAERLRKKRAIEAKRRAAAELERKRRAAELARKAKLAEKRRIQKEKQRARIEAERLARVKAERIAAAKRLKAQRLSKMQAAKQRALAKAEEDRRSQERAERRRAEQLRRDRAQRLAEKPLVVVQVNQADAKRERTRAKLRRERRQGLRGWNPAPHRNNIKGSKWHPRYWGAGVFYYNADTPEVTVIEHNTTIINEAPQINEASQTVVQQSERAIDFRKSLSFGLRGGASTPDLNDGITGGGVGGAIGYRLFEPVGVELSYIHQGDRIDISHDSPLQATGKLFLFPWSNVNPYVSGGLNIAKTDEETFDYGAHGGMGVQFGTGKTAFNLEARYSGFDASEQPSSLSAILGVDYHF